MPAVTYSGKAFLYSGMLYVADVCPPCCDGCIVDCNGEPTSASQMTITVSGTPDEVVFWSPGGIKAITTGWSALDGTYVLTRDVPTCNWNTITFNFDVTVTREDWNLDVNECEVSKNSTIGTETRSATGTISGDPKVNGRVVLADLTAYSMAYSDRSGSYDYNCNSPGTITLHAPPDNQDSACYPYAEYDATVAVM